MELTGSNKLVLEDIADDGPWSIAWYGLGFPSELAGRCQHPQQAEDNRYQTNHQLHTCRSVNITLVVFPPTDVSLVLAVQNTLMLDKNNYI